MPWVLLCAAVVATLPLRLFLRADINREPTFEIVIYLYGFRMQFEGLLERDASLSALGARYGMKLRVYADFRRACFALRARCILSFRGGDIIRAGVLALLEGAPSAKREGHAHGTASH